MIHAVRDAALPLAGALVRAPQDGNPNHILVVQPDHLGDILLSQSAVRAIRHALPCARITAVVGRWSADAARLFWPVDDIVTVAFPGFQRDADQRLLDPYKQLVQEARRLRPLNAGTAIVLRPDAWWAAWLAACIAPKVVGADDPRVRPFTTSVVSIDENAHAVVRAWQIASAALSIPLAPSRDAPELDVVASEPANTALGSLLERLGISGRFVVIHPGSGARVKEWPITRWRAVARELVDDGLEVIVSGSNSEQLLASQVADGIDGVCSVAGETNLELLVALLSRAEVVLGPDCGPLHLAVATGTLTVHLFGPSDPVRYGPWGSPTKHRVVSAYMSCSQCGNLSPARPPSCGCMLAIDTQRVIAEARNLVADAAQ